MAGAGGTIPPVGNETGAEVSRTMSHLSEFGTGASEFQDGFHRMSELHVVGGKLLVPLIRCGSGDWP